MTDKKQTKPVVSIHSSSATLTLQEQEEAQDHLMEALLIHHYESEQEVQTLVEKGMTKLSPPKRAKLYHFSKVWLSLAASAAALMLGLSFLLLAPSNPALAAMDKAIQVIESMGDRSYRVRVAPIRGTHTHQDASTKRRFDEAELYLRGDNQFLFRAITPKGYRMVKGSNGQTSWSLKKDGTTEIKTDPKAIKLPLSARAENITFLDIGASLKALKDRYEISLVEKQKLKSSERFWTKLVMKKVDATIKGPRQIVLFCDLNEQRIQRMVFDKVHLRGAPEPMRVTLDLVSSEPLPDSWFEASHHLSH